MAASPIDFSAQAAPQGPGTSPSSGYRPPQWNQQPQLTSITATLPQATVTTSATANGQSVPEASGSSTQPASSTTFFFDAVIRADHVQELTATKHPIQNGASVVDHSYLEPARLVLEVMFSDALDRYRAGSYTSAQSKSVSAFQTFQYLQALRIPLTVNTKLRQYTSMVIKSLRAADTKETVAGLRMTLYLEQILIGTVTSATQSARPSETGSSQEGTVTPQPLPSSLQNYVDSMGNWSSFQSGSQN